jgi:pyruvate dehydrogenase E1 component beta subunit
MNIVEAVNDAMRVEMERDERVMVLGEDVGRSGGVFRATEELQEQFGEERVVDTPLSESGIVGSAIGLALFGMRPIAEIQFMGFIYPAFDQIASHAGRMRNRTHSESFEAIFAHTPGIKVVIPSNPHDAKGLLISAIRDADPVVFLEPKRIYRAVKAEVPDGDYTVPIGTSRVVQQGEDLTLVAWGAMIPACLETMEVLAAEGVDAELIDVRTLVPFDVETVVESVKKTGRLVVVHEAPKTCGFGAEIVALINEKAFLHLSAPPLRVTGFDTVMPLPKGEHLYLPNADRITATVHQAMEY